MAQDEDADHDPFGDYDGERFYEGTGSQHIKDNISVFQDMERELETLVRKFQIAPTDLENLCKVVMTMSEMMDQARDELHKIGEQKNELERLWKTEKHNWGLEKKKNVELDCRYEEERLKFEADRKNLETIKAQLQTKLNQTISQKAILEQEVQRLKAKSENDELTRKKLVEQYKNQIAEAKMASTHKQVHLNHTSYSPEPEQARRNTRAFSLMPQLPAASQLESDTTSPHLAEEQATAPELEELHVAPVMRTESHPSQPENILINESMQEAALEEETHHAFRGKAHTPCGPENTLGMSLQDELELVEAGNRAPAAKQDVLLEERARWTEERNNLEMELLRAREEKEALESQLAAQDNLLASEKADADMLLKEKDQWDKERAELVREGQKIREEKEAFESQIAQLQVEVQLLKESECALNKELHEMRQDRDQILENYVDQPYENYCITRKELLDLLKMHQTTQIELEKEKEEKERLQKLLEAKKPWYDRFRMKMKNTFVKKEKPSLHVPVQFQLAKSPGSTPRGLVGTPREPSVVTPRDPVGTPREPVGTPREPVGTPREPAGAPREPVGTPREPTTQHPPNVGFGTGPTIQVKEWLVWQDSHMEWDSLPTWVGQVPLSGIETEQIDCTAVGRTYLSEVVRTLIPTRPRSSILSPPSTTIVHQWTSEVWVATSVGSSAFIEILDVLKKHNRDSLRFLVKGTRNIQCMLAVPGVVEVSQDFLETSSITAKYLESTVPGHNRKSRSEDEDFFQDTCISNYTHLSEPIKEERAMLNTTLPRTKTSPVVCKELFKQDVQGTDSDSSRTPDLSRMPDSSRTSGRLGNAVDVSHHPDADTCNPEAAVMWVLTDNCLCFYPASTPCYQCLNRVQLSYKAFCIAYIRGRVLLGHTDSLITVYTKQENRNIWKIYAPDKLIQLPSCSFSDELPDVRCIAEVGDRVWVAAGTSMHIFEAEDMARDGCILMDGLTPEKIICVGSCAVVSTVGPLLMVYDSISTVQLRVIDITSISSILGQPLLIESASPLVSIRTMAADENNVYLGTSAGKVVAIPIQSLRPHITKVASGGSETGCDGNASSNGQSMMLSLHSHHRSVSSLMYVPLPKVGLPTAQGGGVQLPAPQPTLSSKSLVVSAGKGHTNNTEVKGAEEEEEPSAVLRERNDPFQLLVWGHVC